MTEKQNLNRLSALLETGDKLLVAYLMPEFPVPGATLPTLIALQKSGANVIELGMPYSDPLADGRVIQDAAQVAIANGVTLKRLLELVRQARAGAAGEKIHVPIILMGYVNPVLSYGVNRFLDEAAQSGVDGLIIPDLPPEEAQEFRKKCIEKNLSLTFLISPVTSDKRIELIDSLSTHFSYCVSVNATTGTSKLDARTSGDDLNAYLRRVRQNAKKKFVVGFGIKSAEQVRNMNQVADGAVVGTALLSAIASAKTPEGTADAAASFWRALCLNSPQIA
ncbi:MAG: tryptophan synthase subunit alpha [Chlorobiales bacterium]|jgi:tryptophan synthase alpha chain|nr:tryptophan synthase subunit alpha [Chlorobiales bacterium]